MIDIVGRLVIHAIYWFPFESMAMSSTQKARKIGKQHEFKRNVKRDFILANVHGRVPIFDGPVELFIFLFFAIIFK